jgi:mannan endo-1,4-beta-mannosidase
VTYKDDPNIFAWELINEPQCFSDLSGTTLQAWIKEMAAHVKSIDGNHLLEVGLEGYYGESVPERKQYNPGYETGTDFISNNQIPEVDFTTIHIYPEQWTPRLSDEDKAEFAEEWIKAHIEDSNLVLGKPLLVTEFGKSRRNEGDIGKRGDYFENIFNMVYKSARNGGSCSGALFWQLMTPGMESWSDGYEVVLEQSPSTASIINQQSRNIASLTSYLARSLKISSY